MKEIKYLKCINDLPNEDNSTYDFIKGKKYMVDSQSYNEIYVESEDGSCVMFDNDGLKDIFVTA